MEPLKVLFLGESYTACHTYFRGANYVSLPEYADTGIAFANMLKDQGFLVDHLPTHEIPLRCPVRKEEFKEYNVVILSDVASDTMFTPPPSKSGERFLNRLEELRNYVYEGGGLLMCGGYFSFSGVGNTARYEMTPLADVLPVEILNYDDRMECPQGIHPFLTRPGDPLFTGVPAEEWPCFNGYNKTVLKKKAVEFARFGEDPFLAGMECGVGRSFVFTSDCEPNWAPQNFLGWEGYPRLFANIICWTAGKDQSVL